MVESTVGLGQTQIERRPVLADVSIVIPTLGRPILETCLSHIVAGSAWPGALIVVDQGRNPQVEGWLNLLNDAGLVTRYIPSTQRGRAAGINRGIEAATTRFVAITDDDCFVDRQWLKTLVAHLERSPEAICTGRVDAAGDKELEFCLVTSQVPRVYRRPLIRAHPLIGGNMGISLENARRIGPFDEHPSIHAAEDSDWGHRALRLGIPIFYVPEIVVQHYGWRDQGQRAERYRDYARSQGGFYGKYLLRGDGVIIAQAGRDLLRAPVRWVRGMIRHDQDMVDRGRAYTLYLLPGMMAGLRRGRQA